MKKHMICKTCGSEDVKADAFAVWNYPSQDWVVEYIGDKGAICEDCDGETRILEVYHALIDKRSFWIDPNIAFSRDEKREGSKLCEVLAIDASGQIGAIDKVYLPMDFIAGALPQTIVKGKVYEQAET